MLDGDPCVLWSFFYKTTIIRKLKKWNESKIDKKKGKNQRKYVEKTS